MKNSKYLSLIFSLLTALFFFVGFCQADDPDLDQKRNKLIGYMLSKQLPSLHFSDIEVDDQFARATFDLYLKQLDFQKRFLLRSDVDQLRSFADHIDDNLVRGTIVLPATGYDILTERIGQVEKIVAELQQGKIDPNIKEKMETDPEKLDYVTDLGELKQRWQRILKAQIINRYLDLEQEALEE
ncbi:MAG: tail-specific protease, partial [Desulfobacterales bacterium]|nr:tail-specific protease [Desulfobacterales bacterium]